MTPREVVLTLLVFCLALLGVVWVALNVNEWLAIVLLVILLIVFLVYYTYRLEVICSATEDAAEAYLFSEIEALTARFRS